MTEQESKFQRGTVRPVSVAPMMQRTDRHFRVLMRAITKRTLLYTEMVTTGAVLYGDRDRHLQYSPVEHPISLQLGGDDPQALSQCAVLAEDLGYDEVNLNIGCPSDRVQRGRFGACLMAEPERVGEAVTAMRNAVKIPVTVKHRIGIDDLDRYEDMLNFVDTVSKADADRFSVHARKAWLAGLSPKENRTIPPLRYSDVHRLKRERPAQIIEINGGIVDSDAVAHHLEYVDAVMIGRAAYDDPMLFADFDQRFFGDSRTRSSYAQVVSAMIDYASKHIESGHRLHQVTRHMMGLFVGWPGGKRWRRILSQAPTLASADAQLIRDAYEAVRVLNPERLHPISDS